MSELLIGAVALPAAALVVWAVARLALRPFLSTRGNGGATRPSHGGSR